MRPYFLRSPLNELCRNSPSLVMSRYSMSAVNDGYPLKKPPEDGS